MQDRYRPTPQDAFEFRRPTGWEAILGSPMPPEIDTPEKRLSAAVNILQNGSQTLTVLTMPPDTASWNNYNEIHKNMNRKAGMTVIVGNAVIRTALIQTIEPVGAAARSDIDDREWALTQFGISLKPALIFAWQKLLGLGIDGMDVFASNSQKKKDKSGNIVSTPAMLRLRTLTALASVNELQEIDLVNLLKIESSAVRNHIRALRRVELLEAETADTASQDAVTVHEPTAEGLQIAGWYSITQERDQKMHRFSKSLFTNIQQAIVELHQAGRQVTIPAISSYIREHNKGAYAYSPSALVMVLSSYVRANLLERKKFAHQHYSHITIKPRGQQIVHEILFPLSAWAENPYAVSETVTIWRNLQRDPDFYQGLYPQIGTSFVTTSPAKNADRENLTMQILSHIRQHPDQLTITDIAQQLHVSFSAVSKSLEPFWESGELARTKAAKGGKKFLRLQT